MLRTSLRFLRTPAARRAVRPPRSAPPSLSAVSGACRPKSSAAAPADATLAAPRDDPPPTKINVAIDAETDDDDDMEDMFVDTSMGKEWGGADSRRAHARADALRRLGAERPRDGLLDRQKRCKIVDKTL